MRGSVCWWSEGGWGCDFAGDSGMYIATAAHSCSTPPPPSRAPPRQYSRDYLGRSAGAMTRRSGQTRGGGGGAGCWTGELALLRHPTHEGGRIGGGWAWAVAASPRSFRTRFLFVCRRPSLLKDCALPEGRQSSSHRRRLASCGCQSPSNRQAEYLRMPNSFPFAVQHRGGPPCAPISPQRPFSHPGHRNGTEGQPLPPDGVCGGECGGGRGRR